MDVICSRDLYLTLPLLKKEEKKDGVRKSPAMLNNHTNIFKHVLPENHNVILNYTTILKVLEIVL